MPIKFSKFQGTGNDFIMIDQRQQQWIARTDLPIIRALCERRFGIGADGLILIENKVGYDFEMVYYNSDGSQSFCGNGARCAVAFAKYLQIIHSTCKFWAIDGAHEAKISRNVLPGADWVDVKMKDVVDVEQGGEVFVINTGSPHYIRFVNDLKLHNVVEEGRKIRYSDRFKEAGINVNLVANAASGIEVLTYERGVEDETYSCGTGVTAAAIAHFMHGQKKPGVMMIPVKTKGGDLSVRFSTKGDGTFTDVWLCGPAKLVFEGVVGM